MNLPSAIDADTSRVSPNSFSSLISWTYLISALDVPTGTYFNVTLLPVISRTSDTGTVLLLSYVATFFSDENCSARRSKE